MSKTYQWYYDGAAIGGATSKTHTLTSGQTDSDRIECRVEVDYGTDSVAALAEYAAVGAFSPNDLFSLSGDGFNVWPGDTAVSTVWVEDATPSTVATTDGAVVGTVECVTSGDTLSASAAGRDLELDITSTITSLRCPDDQSDMFNATPFMLGLSSIFMAIKIDGANAGAADQVIWRGGGAAPGLEVRIINDAGTYRVAVHHDNVGFVLSTGGITLGTAFTFCYNQAESGDGGDFRINNVLDQTYTANPQSSTFNENKLVARFNEFNGNLYGLTVLGRRFTAGELTDMQTYAESLMP